MSKPKKEKKEGKFRESKTYEIENADQLEWLSEQINVALRESKTRYFQSEGFLSVTLVGSRKNCV